MDFSPSMMESEIRALTRKFAQTEMAPHIEADEDEERFRPEWITKLGELGLTAIPVPEEYGGAGLGYAEYCAVIEELAAVNAGYAISIAVTGLPQVILANSGNEEQKKKYIPPLASGEAIGSFALSEASSGSDAASLRCQAKKDGDHYVLSGTKLWITQADVASTLMVMARTGEPGPKGVSCFIVEKDDPGFKLGKREKKMGWNTSHTMEILFEDCRIPADRLVGKEGEGFNVAMTALNSGRITIAATANGIARAALEVAASHSRERQQFGRPIGEFQGVSFMLADMKAGLDAARLLTQKAAWLKDQGQDFATAASEAKLFATDHCMKVTTDAVQILGGSGYTREFPVERHMREAKVLQIVEGTNQVQRMIIGRDLFRNPEKEI
jgi:alkylation response protein AidB-like acyl-CoA dehydrogenase